jgi:uncharacterized repeat protein (TIGR01451 family)
MAVVPPIASAQAITTVTLQGTTGPPGSVLRGNLAATSTTQSTVTVTAGAGSIRYSYTPTPEFGASACVTVTSTAGAKNVNPVLPRAPGAYTISFQAFSDGVCQQGGSNVVTREVTVTQPAENPPIALRCNPLRVLLVLDESASVDQSDATEDVQAAAAGFVAALEGTGAELGIDAFSITARHGVDYHEVDAGTSNMFTQWINNAAGTNGYNPAGANRSGTNWDAAFRNVTGAPNLIVFVTDGNPNTRNSATGTGTSSPNTALDGSWGVMTPAAAAADAVKLAAPVPSRVFAIGVGSAVDDAASESRLTAVSGPNEFNPGDDFTRSDYTTVSFDELEDSLTGIVARLCGSSLTITKYERAANADAWLEAPGWRFIAGLRTTGHIWLTPSAAGTGRTASLVTNNDGVAGFQWRLTEGGESRIRVIRERSKPGFRFVLARCRIYNPEGQLSRTLRSTRRVPRFTLEEREYATCAVYNRQRAAHLQVVKRLVPDNDPGRFDLFVGDQAEAEGVGNGEGTRRILLPLGVHTVSERAAAGTTLADYSVSTTCVNKRNGEEVASGVGTESAPVSVRLRREADDVVCTITNTSTTQGNLTVVKHLVPGNDAGLFDLLITRQDGAEVAREPDAGDGDTTGRVRLPFGTYNVSEEAGTNTVLADYSISITCIDETTGDTLVTAEGPGPLPVTLETADVLCTITNKRIPEPEVARLTVVKRLEPSDDPGLFDLRVNGTTFAPRVGDRGTTGPLEFELGTYTVSERGAGGTRLADYSTSITCRNDGRVVARETGPSVSVELRRETDDIVCTITNTRTATPPSGGGTVPEDPCLDLDTDDPACVEVQEGPNLVVSKRMPASARVGDRVRITITVQNVGRNTARGVRLHETPPRGARIVSVGRGGSIQSDGTAVWDLGNLASGARRTVRATMLVGRTGSLMNTAVAEAGNAQPGFAVAGVSASGAARRPPAPAVTG